MSWNLLPCNSQQVLIDPPGRRSPLSPRCVHLGLTMLASTSAVLPMKFLNWPLSWLPSQLLGTRSLILYGLAVSAGSLCMVLELLPIASSLPLIACVHLFTTSLQGVCHLLSDLLLQRHQVCGGGHLQLTPPAMALIIAPLPCQMEVYLHDAT